MDVSVIIPSYNAEPLIAEQLDALARQTYPGEWEVIVVDNRSTDRTRDIALGFAERIPLLRVVDAGEARGAGYARNVGVAHAKGELLLFCDADDVADERWVEAMAKALAEHPFVGGRREVELLNEPWIVATRDMGQQEDLPLWGGFLYSVAGCNMGMRREVFDRTGLFDVTMLRMQDADYSFRVQLAGFDARFAPDAVVHYRIRGSMTGMYRQARDWSETAVLLHRRYEPHGLRRPNPLRWCVGLALSVPRLLTIRDRASLAHWVYRHACRVGRLRGSIRYRTLVL